MKVKWHLSDSPYVWFEDSPSFVENAMKLTSPKQRQRLALDLAKSEKNHHYRTFIIPNSDITFSIKNPIYTGEVVSQEEISSLLIA